MTEKNSLIGTNGTDPNTLIGEGGKDDYGNYLSAVKYTSDGVYSFNQASNSWFNFITFTSTRFILKRGIRFFIGEQSLDDFIINQVNNFLGGKSFEDFLIKHIKNMLSRFFEIESDGTLRIKGNLVVEGNCDTKGIITACGGFVDSNEQDNENEDPPINVIKTQDESDYINKSPP